MSSKVLLVFCDGTSMDGNRAGGPTDGKGGSSHHATNVLRLSRAVKEHTIDNRRQIVFYQSGVGSETNFQGENTAGATASQALGTAVASKIRDAYAFIAQNFEPGDEICLFGFSRGAFTARKLSGLIDKIGLLDRETLGYLAKIWVQLVKGEEPSIPPDTRRTNIKCVGVWDTVGSVLNHVDVLSMKDTHLPSTVDIALHALSLQENRGRFPPTLWAVPECGLREGQILKQLWFPGVHSDVGGGYERHELADIALFWMAGEVNSFINLDLAFLRRNGQVDPDPWGTSQPNNEFMKLRPIERNIIGHGTRLANAQLTKDSVFHESVKFAPAVLKEPKYMITLDTLKRKFGENWTPTCPPLNAFEKERKDQWGISAGMDEPIVYEELSDLSIGPGVYWTPAKDGRIPPNAIQGGTEGKDGSSLFVARALYMDGLHPGKANSSQCWIGLEGKKITIEDSYELLVGPESAVKWVSVKGEYSPDKLERYIPVRAGREKDGTPLYIAQADLPGGAHCGKVKEDSLAMIPYLYEEHVVDSYRVLVYSEPVL